MSYKYIKSFRERRRVFLREYLGGKCVICGATEELEFDHINPDLKLFDISNHLHLNLKDLLIEVNKCQLLCSPHHIAKSIRDSLGKNSWNAGTATHGKRYTAYTLNCNCNKCDQFKINQRSKTNPYIHFGGSQIIHGTRGGYLKEGRLGLERCEACKKANAEYHNKFRGRIV